MLDPETGSTIGPGTRYSLRVSDSDWTRPDGVRTGDIPLIDPRARRVQLMGKNEFSPTMNGVSEYPLSVMTSSKPYEWLHDKPATFCTDLNICETHVVTSTLGMPMAPERQSLEGSYAGMATPEYLAYLDEQGYNAVSILPVHAAMSEPHLYREGRRNFWNYNTVSYFALNESYAAGDDPVQEFREMVDTLHGAGKTVILDVVYNHTAEGGPADPTYSYEALNRANIYKFSSRGTGNLVDDSGCGNTLDMMKPAVVREIIESLRYWVDDMGVDGFRFDLAGVLAQGHSDLDQAPLMKAIAADPVLSRVHLIAEPWSAVGDYRLHDFRHSRDVPWMAWNDQFREVAKAAMFGWFKKQELSNRMGGHDNPRTTVNYVSAHDGKTLHDMAPDDKAERLALAMVALSQGIPQRQAGSEAGYSQWGDGNAYSRAEDETAPYTLPWKALKDPDSPEAKLYAFSAVVNRIRNEHPIFRQRNLMIGRVVNVLERNEPHPLGERDVDWLGAFGSRLTEREWRDPDQFMGMLLSGVEVGDDSFLLLVNGNDRQVRAALGHQSNPSFYGVYEKLVDTADGFTVSGEDGDGIRLDEGQVVVAPRSLMVLRQIAQHLPGTSGSFKPFSLLG